MEQKKTYGTPEINLVAINEDVLTISVSDDPIKSDFGWYVGGGN